MNKHTFSFTYDAEAIREVIRMNNLIGKNINKSEEPLMDIEDFTEAMEVINRIKARL